MNKTNPAAINARSRKADMYAEVERLRALLDAQESELAMLRESKARLTQRLDNAVTSYRALRAERDALKAKSEERGAKSDAPCDCTVSHGDVVIHERDCQQAHDEEYIASINADAKEIARRCAILLKRSCRPAGDRVEQFKDGAWEIVPQRVLRYATR